MVNMRKDTCCEENCNKPKHVTDKGTRYNRCKNHQAKREAAYHREYIIKSKIEAEELYTPEFEAWYKTFKKLLKNTNDKRERCSSCGVIPNYYSHLVYKECEMMKKGR